MTAEMMLGGIHCNKVLHDDHRDDDERGRNLHDGVAVRSNTGVFWSLWIGGLWEQSERSNSTVHKRGREMLSFYVLVAALSTQDRKSSTEEQKAREQQRNVTARRFREAREIIPGCEKHAKSATPCRTSVSSGRRT